MPAEPQVVDLVGTSIGHYTIEAVLGRGGMGVVYRAVQAPLGRTVALKVIHDQLAQDEAMAARFMREAKIASSLTNPNTITVFDFGVESGRLYMAMELLEGESLAARLRRVQVLEPAEAIEIAIQVCVSLAEAHARSIVHRDLKSENVFLTTGHGGALRVKVLDYGIARAGAESAAGAAKPETLTRAGTLLGTPAYMAPEQARGEPVDGRADLWALGVILYESLTGVRPFCGDNPVVILGKLLSDPPPPMATVARGPRPGPALEGLVDALLAKDREERPADATVVEAHLRAIAAGKGTGAVAAADKTADPVLEESWGLPLELATSPPSRPSSPTLLTPPSTPLASAAPAAHAPAAPPRPSVPALKIEAPDDSFDRDIVPKLEVDRGPRHSPDVPLAVARPSAAPRPRTSRPAPPPERRGGAGIVLVAGLFVAAGAAGWFWLRPAVKFDGVLPTAVTSAPSPVADTAPPAPPATPPEPSFSQRALQRQEDDLRAAGWTQTPLPSGSWAGSYELEGGALRLFDEGGRVTGTFEEALRSGGIQGSVRDGVLEFAWRAAGTGAVRGTQASTGQGLLRAWTRRADRKLVGTWGYGDSRDGAVWVASPAHAATAKRPRR